MIPLIPLRNPILLLSSILLLSLSIEPAEPVESAETMKIHPIPKKRNISESTQIINPHKKLRRLPHTFNKVLELPFHSEADVAIDETPQRFRFVVSTDEVGRDVRTRTVEIYPGVTKIVLQGRNVAELNLDELQLDMWRFRLPAEAKPEMASAEYVDGELIVTVPKDMEFESNKEEEGWGERNRAGRLVLVQ